MNHAFGLMLLSVFVGTAFYHVLEHLFRRWYWQYLFRQRTNNPAVIYPPTTDWALVAVAAWFACAVVVAAVRAFRGRNAE